MWKEVFEEVYSIVERQAKVVVVGVVKEIVGGDGNSDGSSS